MRHPPANSSVERCGFAHANKDVVTTVRATTVAEVPVAAPEAVTVVAGLEVETAEVATPEVLAPMI
jgi:hypothetical protein